MTTQVVIRPECSFERLSAALSGAGWEKADASPQPLLPGEPEYAVFERPGARAHYSFNPVCRLRVLELPPDAPALPSALPRVSREDLERWLVSRDEHTLLLGVLAAGLLGGDDALAARVAALAAHPRPAIAQAAARALQKMPPASGSGSGSDSGSTSGSGSGAQDAALMTAALLAEQVKPLLAALARDIHGAVLAQLLPRAADFERVFEGAETVAQARAAYAEPRPRAAWERPRGDQTQLRVHVAPAGMLGENNALSQHFPGGYRSIAPFLNPHRVWVAWKYTRPGESSGLSHNGLVWCDDHWAWFPKPYRALAPLLAPR
jgi:hypothetical protein